MIPFGRPVHCPEVPVRRVLGPVWTVAFVIRAAAWLSASSVLLLVGWSVTKALGSPLLAVVVSGMLFLVGVSLRSAVEPRRP